MPYSDTTKQKEAQRRHYNNNKEYFYHRTKERRKKKTEWLQSFLSSRACVSCGETAPECLDFHHVDPSTKEGMVTEMINSLRGFDRIKEEMEKCIILCSNCHRKVHKGTLSSTTFDNSLIKLTEEDAQSWCR